MLCVESEAILIRPIFLRLMRSLKRRQFLRRQLCLHSTVGLGGKLEAEHVVDETLSLCVTLDPLGNCLQSITNVQS